MSAHLTPRALVDVAERAGHRAPRLDRPFRYVYLGCGDGNTVAQVATDYPHATVSAWDWRADMVARARARCDDAGLANLHVQERRGPPAALGANGEVVDMVVVDGVLERVDGGLRTDLCDAVLTGLRPGGLLCVRYATTVGWIEIAPMARLMRRIASGHTADPGTVVPRVLAVLQQLRAGGAGYVVDRPRVAAWVEELMHTAHDEISSTWLRDDFRPLSHAAISDMFPGFGYVGRADEAPRLTGCLGEFVDSAPSPLARQALLDLATHPLHRADVFVGGWA